MSEKNPIKKVIDTGPPSRSQPATSGEVLGRGPSRRKEFLSSAAPESIRRTLADAEHHMGQGRTREEAVDIALATVGGRGQKLGQWAELRKETLRYLG